MTQKEWFYSDEFKNRYHCELPLGAFCSSEGTVFRLWAPTAEVVALHLYDNGTENGLMETILLPKGEQGVWIYETVRNLDGVYYDYEVTVDGVRRRTADPYARAAGVNGSRSMVLDLRRTDPEGWDMDQAPAKTPENVIYEIHVKDFTWDPACGVTPNHRGKYKALCETGTTLNGDGVHATGISYLKELGVTHVQLMPVYDYGSVDEAGHPDQFNWGYDPVNYNVPEGSYSTDPFHGEVRVRELKEAIQALHENGFRVIMDVVYNHTYELDSWLMRTVPWYYYRQLDNGKESNGSGCGSEIASERSMCGKYILDSILYWTEEYHMDGFRFDLMGMLDVELMNTIQAELDKRYGKGEKLLYGEPWAGGQCAEKPGTLLCHKGHMKLVDPQIGAFCDNTRDAVKGGLMDVYATGFVNGGGLDAQWLAQCVRGWAGEVFRSPYQTITYLSSHDDWTLWDKLVYTMDRKQDFTGFQPTILRANRLAAAMYFCCQGNVFMLSGEEFARSKEGVKNTYCSPVQLNRMDWSRAWANKNLVNYYRGLIALRMQLPGLQDKSERACDRILDAWQADRDCAGILVDNDGPDSRWKRLCLLFNAQKQSVELQLPKGTWQVLADGKDSFLWKKQKTVEGAAHLTPVSALIWGEI